jgi:hypothetical protein
MILAQPRFLLSLQPFLPFQSSLPWRSLQPFLPFPPPCRLQFA